MDLDIDQLLAVTGGDVDLAEEVLEIFRSQADVWGRMLDPALPHSDWADAAHSIKGSALSIGVKELADVCLVAEQLGRSGTASKAAAASALSDVKTSLALALEACARASHALSKPGLRASND